MRKQLFHDCFAMKAVHGRREFLAAMAYTSILAHSPACNALRQNSPTANDTTGCCLLHKARRPS